MEPSRKISPWIVVAIIVVAGWIATAAIGVYGFVRVKHASRVLDVVGSSRKRIRSDLAVWTGTFSAQAPHMADAYRQMTNGAARVKAYLQGKGVGEKEVVFSAITTTTNYQMDSKGQQTSIIESYKLSQTVEVRSGNVDLVADLSRKATELIEQGVEFGSSAPRYYFTGIADLKIEVLASASRDARVRADKIAENTGSHAGSLVSAEMGVFQITALYSTDVSDLGVYDTTTIDKEITAVVICKFGIDN